MKQRLGCYRRNYLHWENQYKVLLQPHKWEVPAQALTQIITEQGFTIKRAPLGRGRLSEIHWDSRTILLDLDFKQRLRHENRYQEVLHSTLCFELSHIILHQGKAHQTHHEIEAWVWSTLFLCPWWHIRKSLDYKALESEPLNKKQRWQKIYGLAQWLEISPTLVHIALELYDVYHRPSHERAA